jgi:hypothetical protein
MAPPQSTTKNETLAPAQSTTSNETTAEIPLHSDDVPLQPKSGNEEKNADVKDATLAENAVQGGVHDQSGKDYVSLQRLALAKELATAIGDDEQSEIDHFTSVKSRKNSRRTLQGLRLLKKKIAAAEAQNKPKVAKFLRKALAKQLLNRKRSGGPTKVCGRALTDIQKR